MSVKDSGWVEKWFSNVREQARMRVTRIPFRESAEWTMRNGGLIHRSGRFFQVVAVQWEDAQQQRHNQPFLHQPEVGTLGFVIHDNELLMQAKVEPGNVGMVQMAPTCQATASNLDRVHGGEAPLYSEWFAPGSNQRVYDTLQSEQGSRFFGKFNRNVLARVGGRVPSHENFRWTPVDAVLELMHADYLINTDARSAIVCSPWELLVQHEPFSRVSTAFARDLSVSLATPVTDNGLQAELRTLRALVQPPVIIRLDELDGWQVFEDSITPVAGKPFEIYQIKVNAATREVANWDQPILSSFSDGYVELVCGRVEGILRFLFSFQAEAGLGNAIEFGPSLMVEPGESLPESTYQSYPQAVIVAQCRQSDEGGRFFQDVSTYRLIDLGEVPDDLIKTGKWLTLAEIRSLISAGGWFTNEARSALSLILFWL
jgi:dTDP-4-dehydro-6-deoxy-alpha-D-glucopyranose 2,3-dehydratase